MISVIIPVHNDLDLLEQFFPDMMDQLESQGVTDIIVVNDASQDQTSVYLATYFPTVRILNSPIQRSLGMAVNLAFRYVKYPVTWILRPNIRIQAFDLDGALRYFERPDVFAVVPHLHDLHQKTVGICNRLDISTGDYYWDAPHDFSDMEGRYCVMTTMAHFMVASEKFRFVGGFDELFFPIYDQHRDLAMVAYRMGWKSIFTRRIQLDIQPLEAPISRFHHQYSAQLSLMHQYLYDWKHVEGKWRIFRMVLGVLVRMCTFQIAHFRAIMKIIPRLGYVVSRPSYGFSTRDVAAFFSEGECVR